MENYFLLEEEELDQYAHMIPQWLLESYEEGDDLTFWGMKDFGVPCGAAVLSGDGNVQTLKCLYVAEDYRGSGRGGRFLQELMMNARESGYDTFEMKYIPERYPAFGRLLSAYPYSETEELIGSARCTLSQLAGIKHFQGSYGTVKALSECTNESLTPLYREIGERGDDLVSLPLKKKDYLADYCAVSMEDGKPAGLLLVEKIGEEVNIPLFVNLSHNPVAPLEMMRFAIQKGMQEYAPETVCRFAVISETLLQLLEKLGISMIEKRHCYRVDLSYFDRYQWELLTDLIMIDEREIIE